MWHERSGLLWKGWFRKCMGYLGVCCKMAAYLKFCVISLTWLHWLTIKLIFCTQVLHAEPHEDIIISKDSGYQDFNKVSITSETPTCQESYLPREVHMTFKFEFSLIGHVFLRLHRCPSNIIHLAYLVSLVNMIRKCLKMSSYTYIMFKGSNFIVVVVHTTKVVASSSRKSRIQGKNSN